MDANDLRIRIDDEGRLEIVDPDLSALPLLRELDPSYEILTAPLRGFSRPRFLQCLSADTGVPIEEIRCMSEEGLWDLHEAGMVALRNEERFRLQRNGSGSVLDVKTELSRRILKNCRLCARRCGVDRTAGELGVCGLGIDGIVTKHALHIAEEAPINPSLLVSLAGCGLRCRYCQQGPLQDARSVNGAPLSADFWPGFDAPKARSLSFIGGNPDESLYAVLRFLRTAPEDWNLPIVWNCHGYGTSETFRLLAGIIDCYVPDFRYGHPDCGKRFSGVEDYPRVAEKCIRLMLKQGVPVICRILALPGHTKCCHVPVLRRLSALNRSNLLVSIRGQYCPDWRIGPEDGTLARRPIRAEVRALNTIADGLGLRRLS